MKRGVREKKIKYIDLLHKSSTVLLYSDIIRCFVLVLEVKKFNSANFLVQKFAFDILSLHTDVSLSNDYARTFRELVRI